MNNPELSRGEVQTLDEQFHLTIAEYSDNPLLADMMAALRRGISVSMLAAFEAEKDWPAFCSVLVSEHAGIVDAMEAGDTDSALELMREHIQGFYSVLPE